MAVQGHMQPTLVIVRNFRTQFAEYMLNILEMQISADRMREQTVKNLAMAMVHEKLSLLDLQANLLSAWEQCFDTNQHRCKNRQRFAAVSDDEPQGQRAAMQATGTFGLGVFQKRQPLVLARGHSNRLSTIPASSFLRSVASGWQDWLSCTCWIVRDCQCRLQRSPPNCAGKMTDWTIRQAQLQDAPALALCFEQAYAVYQGRIADLPPISEGILENIQNHDVWLATSAETVIGGMVLVHRDDHTLLANIGISPAAKGLGIGRALLEYAENQCRKRKVPEMRLTTHADLPELAKFYEHLGWREYQRKANKVFMSKPIGS